MISVPRAVELAVTGLRRLQRRYLTGEEAWKKGQAWDDGRAHQRWQEYDEAIAALLKLVEEPEQERMF